jgi:hypothetical protein
MTSRPAPSDSRPRHAPSDEGFVLVGVVMFVLALTILGLSLFSLSSFEAQFLSRSTRGAQTLYDATSGIEWAKTVLAKEKRLIAVQNGQAADAAGTRPPRVSYVVAWQGSDSTGIINYSSTAPVHIRSWADDGRGRRRLVEMQYTPQSPQGVYRSVIDSYDDIEAVAVDGLGPRLTILDGPVRVNNNDIDQTWQSLPGPPIPMGDGVPYPQVGTFISQHTVTKPVVHNGAIGRYTLTADPGVVTYFTSPANPTFTIYDSHNNPEFNVSGTCVWIIPKGMRFDNLVVVRGTSADRLVIVAGRIEFIPGVDPPSAWNKGIWFFSGFGSPLGAPSSEQVPMVLVSDAEIAIDRAGFTSGQGTANKISMFGNGVFLKGPNGGNSQILRYDPAIMDPIIDELAGGGALPNVTGSSASFIPIAGTWRELDPDNPS